MIDDQQLLSGIAKQEAGALSLLYDRYAKLVFGVALTILHDTDDAEDIVQEVFVQVWKKAEQYQPSLGAVKNWLVRIAHNRAINLVRSKRMRERQAEVRIPDEGETVTADVAAALVDENPWVIAMRNEESRGLSQALEFLPEEQRMLIDLAFFQGFSHSEIAEMAALPLGTVKTRIRTGIMALRQKLAYLKDEAGEF
jgi:RNA polymerase sigma-70 factor (ECF subfamily)